MTEDKGIGYKRWLTKHNLKVMAQTVNLLQEKGLTDEDALNQRIAELETKYHDSLAVVKGLEGRMKANKELRHHVAAYASTKGIVQQFNTAKRPAAFEAVSYTHLNVYKRQPQNRGRIPRDAWTGSSQCCRRTTRTPTHPCQVRYQHRNR